MIRILIGILFLVVIQNSSAQSKYALQLEDTTYYYTDKDFELIIAASAGDTNKLQAFLNINADVNTTSYEGVTPLMFAAQNGKLRTVEILIDSGAKVNLKPLNMVDALLGACIAGHVEIADTLILNGANVNTLNMDGQTPLMYAAAFNNSLLTDVLLFYNAEVNMADHYGNTALHFCAYYNNLESSKQLLSQNAVVDIADEDGFTPFMIAAQNGNIEILEILLDNGADLNRVNSNGLNALSLAILGKHDYVVDFLVSSGADVNYDLSKKLNQYDLAGLYGNKQSSDVLKNAGAKPHVKSWIDKLYLNPAANFNAQDILMGAHIGIIDSKSNFHLEVGYKTRPWVRSVLNEVSEEQYYQFWEKKSLLHIGIDKSFSIKELPFDENLGLFGGLNVAYTYGNYRGANQKPEDQILLIPKIGVFYHYKLLNLKFNYEYVNFENSPISSHRLGLSVGLMINMVKNKINVKPPPIL